MTSLRHIFFISFVFPPTKARRKWFSIRKSAFSLATLLHLSQTISSNFSFSFDFWYLELKLLGELFFFLFFFVKFIQSQPPDGLNQNTDRNSFYFWLSTRARPRNINIYIFYLFNVYHDLTFSGHVLFFEIKNSSMGRCGYVAWRRNISVFGAETLVRLQHIGRVTQIAKQQPTSPGSGNASTLCCFPSICFDRVETNFSISRWFRVPLHKITVREQCNRAMFVKITLETFQNALFICSSNVGSQQFRQRYRHKEHVIVECF